MLGDRMYLCAVSAGLSNSMGLQFPHRLEQKFEPQIFSLFLMSGCSSKVWIHR